MDNQRVLLIEHGNSFMVDNIFHALQDDHIMVTPIEPNVIDLKQHQNDASVVLFYLGKYINTESPFLSTLRDICRRGHKKLCVFGDKAEYDVLLRTIPENELEYVMLRPIQVPVLVDKIRGLVSGADSGKPNKKTIMLVDDDSDYLKIASKWLEDTDRYQVTLLNAGTQAISYLNLHKPDLILLDYEMPIMSGADVLQKIREMEDKKDIPVIFLTGVGDRENVLKVLSLKPAGYILKTEGRELLLKRVADFFGR